MGKRRDRSGEEPSVPTHGVQFLAPHTAFGRFSIVESAEKGKHLTRNFWPARGICIEGSETVCVFSVNFHNSEFS